MRSYIASKGFSLVELMVVVAIIGILAAVAVPNYQRYVLKSKITNLVAKAKSLKTMQEESIANNSVCLPFAGNIVPANDPDIWYYWYRPDHITNTGCEVGVRSDFVSLGTEFEIYYVSTPLVNLVSPADAIQWTCYYHTFGNNAAQVKIAAAMPPNCTVRAY